MDPRARPARLGLYPNEPRQVDRALFDKDSQPHHLDEALEAADGALAEFRKANAAFYIEKAEHQRQKILAAKGKL